MHLLVSSSHPIHLKNTLTKELHSRLCVQKQKAHWTTSYSHQVICIKVLFPFSDSSCLCQEGGGGGLECCAHHSESLTCVLWSVSKFLNASLLCMQVSKVTETEGHLDQNPHLQLIDESFPHDEWSHFTWFWGIYFAGTFHFDFNGIKSFSISLLTSRSVLPITFLPDTVTEKTLLSMLGEIIDCCSMRAIIKTKTTVY